MRPAPSIKIGVIIAGNLATPARGAMRLIPGPKLSGPGVKAQASPIVSNMQAAMASCGDLEPRTRKSKAG